MFKPSAKFFKKNHFKYWKDTSKGSISKELKLINSYNRIHAIVNTQKEGKKLVA